MTQSLTDLVSEAEEHAEEFDSRKDVESKIEAEKEELRSAKARLESLEEEVRKLVWYRSVLEELFDHESVEIESAIEEVDDLVCDELVDSAEEVIDYDFSGLDNRVDEVRDDVKEDLEELEESLEEKQEDWEQKISNARKIIQIPGLLDETDKENLQEVSKSIEEFVTGEIWEVRSVEEVESLEDEWNLLTSTFNSHRTIHSYDNVKEEYGISDESMEILKELVEDSETNLDKFNPDILEDLKQLEEFIKQVKISFSN